MSFDSLLTDTVTLLKKTGEKVESIKASVQQNKIYINRPDILIESGDLIHRQMSNGGEETYKVIDPGFNEKFHGIPAGYQIEVNKLGLPEARAAVNNITYNISGTNNRINSNSIDNSINTISSNSEIQEQINSLRNALDELKLTQEEKTESLEVIDAIQTEFNNEKPSKTVVKTLLSALPQAANIATIATFLISLM